MVGAQCVVNLDAPSSTLLNKNKLSEDQIKKGTLKSRSRPLTSCRITVNNAKNINY